MGTSETLCKRCGTCCSKGGPALHFDDLPLIASAKIPLNRLITIRKGELVMKPGSDVPQASLCELIKISGFGQDWKCFYFDSDRKGCKIYQDRPVSCIALQCWDTAAVEEMIEKDTISRLDIIAEDDPLHALVVRHEGLCPCPDMSELAETIRCGRPLEIKTLEELVNDDLRLRSETVSKFKISVELELFYFGRPIFQLMQQIGVGFVEEQGRLKVVDTA